MLNKREVCYSNSLNISSIYIKVISNIKVWYLFCTAQSHLCYRQYDLRCPDLCRPNSKNVLVNLDSHIGIQSEFKCIAINPVRPEFMAVGANDPYVRVYDRRMLTCQSMKTEDGKPRLWFWIYYISHDLFTILVYCDVRGQCIDP